MKARAVHFIGALTRIGLQIRRNLRMSGELERQLRSKGPVKDAAGRLTAPKQQRAVRQKASMIRQGLAASLDDNSLPTIVWAEKVLKSPESWSVHEADMAAPMATSMGRKEHVGSSLETFRAPELDRSPRVPPAT